MCSGSSVVGGELANPELLANRTIMKRNSRPEPEVLPGADDQLDCQPGAAVDGTAPEPSEFAGEPAHQTSLIELDDLEEDEHAEEDEHEVTWSNVGVHQNGPGALSAWRPVRGRWSVALEGLALAIEKPITRLTTAQLNPLYHTGTIAFFLLAVVGLTGLYLFFFFQYGFDASYLAVERMESQFIARLIRAIHRYASGALVIATLLHAYRTLFLEKFRGPRWLAWLTGMVMTAMVWFAGVTGYWLIWDVRAQAINDLFLDWLDGLASLGPRYLILLATAQERGLSWIIFLVLLIVHVALFLALLGFFILHIRRLKRPKWLPPLHWIAAVAGVLFVLSLVFPVGMLPQADFQQLPAAISVDPLYLFYLPFGRSWLFWLAIGAIFLTLAALPWLARARKSRVQVTDNASVASPTVANVAVATVSEDTMIAPWPPKVNIIKDRCTGCTKCALDCPYGAIEMVERHDGKPHKFIAIETTSLCVSCGICVGSCDGVAVTMGRVPPESIWQTVAQTVNLTPLTPQVASPVNVEPTIPAGIAGATVVYTCDRHARHGARPYLDGAASRNSGRRDPVVVVLPCVGTLPPDLAARTLDAGAAEVRVIGCPPDDCANREGNLWTEQRLTRERLPRLRKAYANAPIAAFWLAPNEFEAGLAASIPADENGQPNYAAARSLQQGFNWRNLSAAVLILGVVLLVQILLNDIPMLANPRGQALVQMVISGIAIDDLIVQDGTQAASGQLQLLVDGAVAAEESLTLTQGETSGASHPPLLLAASVPAGEHDVQLRFVEPESETGRALYEQSAILEDGAILRPELWLGNWSGCPQGIVDDPPYQCVR